MGDSLAKIEEETREIRGLRDGIDDCNRMLASLKTLLLEQQTGRSQREAKLTTDLAHAQDETRIVRSDLDQVRRERDQAQRQLGDANAERDRLRAEIGDERERKQVEGEAWKTERTKLESENTGLKAELDKLRPLAPKLKALQTRLAAIRRLFWPPFLDDPRLEITFDQIEQAAIGSPANHEAQGLLASLLLFQALLDGDRPEDLAMSLRDLSRYLLGFLKGIGLGDAIWTTSEAWAAVFNESAAERFTIRPLKPGERFELDYVLPQIPPPYPQSVQEVYSWCVFVQGSNGTVAYKAEVR